MTIEVFREHRRLTWICNYALVLTVAVLLFFCRFGFDVSLWDPRNYGWLLRGDIAQSFIGWLFFYFGSWHWPLGLLPQYVPVLSANIALTDSQPWFSILLKLVVPKGDQPLQFIGLWLLICYILQAYFALKIATLFFEGRCKRLLLMLLLTFSPVLLYRVGHVSLCAHWVILASLFLCFKQDYSVKTFLSWLLLAFLTSLTHPYFLPPVALFVLFFYLVPVMQRPARSPLRLGFAFIKGFSVWGASFFGLWLIGLLGGTDRSGIPNFFCADVFAFINPVAQGFFLPSLWRLRMGQYEGYSYLGLGVILMLLGSLYALWRKRRTALASWLSQPGWQIVSLVAVGLMLWSWGSDVRFFGHFLLSLRPLYSLFEPVLNSFRSAGRFNWTMCYLLTIFSFYTVERTLPAKWSLPILLVCVVIQFIDISPYFQWKSSPVANEPKLESALWDEFAKKIKDIVIYPPFVLPDLPGQIVSDKPDYIPLAIFAARHQLNLHSGAFVVPSEHLLREYLEQVHRQFEQNLFHKDALYILGDQAAKQAAGKGLSCRDIDHYHVCFLP